MTSAPRLGLLRVGQRPSTHFTMQDIMDGRLDYQHTGQHHTAVFSAPQDVLYGEHEGGGDAYRGTDHSAPEDTATDYGEIYTQPEDLHGPGREIYRGGMEVVYKLNDDKTTYSPDRYEYYIEEEISLKPGQVVSLGPNGADLHGEALDSNRVQDYFEFIVMDENSNGFVAGTGQVTHTPQVRSSLNMKLKQFSQ